MAHLSLAVLVVYLKAFFNTRTSIYGNEGDTGYFSYIRSKDGSGMTFVDVDIAGRAVAVIPSTATSHNIANKTLLNQLGLTENDLH